MRGFDPKGIKGKDAYQMAWCAQAELYRSDDRLAIYSGGYMFFIEESQMRPEAE